MSHEDSLDDETKAILAEANSDDSSESIIPKEDKKIVKHYYVSGNQYDEFEDIVVKDDEVDDKKDYW